MQSDPQVLIAHPDQGIHSIADMEGPADHAVRRVDHRFWVWLKAKYGSPTPRSAPTHPRAAFLTSPSVIEEGYLTSEPYTIEKESGVKPAVFCWPTRAIPATRHGAGQRQLIAANPKAVKALSTARLRAGNPISTAIPGRATP